MAMTSSDNPPTGAADEPTDASAQGEPSIAERMSSGMADGSDRVSRGMSMAGRQPSPALDQATRRGEAWLATCRTNVRANPLVSLSGAFLAGMLVCRLIKP